MANFTTDYTFRDSLRTIEFKAGDETLDAQVIAAAELVGAIAKDISDVDHGIAKGGKISRPIHLKG